MSVGESGIVWFWKLGEVVGKDVGFVEGLILVEGECRVYMTVDQANNEMS